jgi:hypothetical protein
MGRPKARMPGSPDGSAKGGAMHEHSRCTVPYSEPRHPLVRAAAGAYAPSFSGFPLLRRVVSPQPDAVASGRPATDNASDISELTWR